VSDPVNPFAPPEADDPRAFTVGGGRFRVQGNTLIVERDGTLPALCIFSGEPTLGQRERRRLAWAPPWTAVFVISPLLYLVVYLIVRKRAWLDYALSERARARRRSGLYTLFGGIAAAVALGFIGGFADMPLLIVFAPLVFLVVLVFGMIKGRVLQVIRIDQTHVHLKLRPEAAQAFARAP
jgi:hypothetical protein